MCQSQTLKLLVLALLFLRVVRKHPANTMRKTTRRSLLPSQRAFAKVVAPETLGRILDTRAEAHSFNSLRSPTGGQQTELKGYRSLQKSCNARIRPLGPIACSGSRLSYLRVLAIWKPPTPVGVRSKRDWFRFVGCSDTVEINR